MKVKIASNHPNFNVANAVGTMAERGNKFSTVFIAGNSWKIKNKFIIPLHPAHK